MGTRPNVLIVTEDSSTLNRWAQWLEGEGFTVSSCPGPHVVSRCPRLDGFPCSLRQGADLAVVDIHPLGAGELYGGWTERACTKIPNDLRTVLVHEPHVESGFAERGIHLGYRVTRESLLSAVRRVRRVFTAGGSSSDLR
jgi:hypothetical protein